MYEARGLVRPARTPGGTRLYSDADLERLRLIQRLTTELGLNLAGVEHVLRLAGRAQSHSARMERSSASCGTRSQRAPHVQARDRALPPATGTAAPRS